MELPSLIGGVFTLAVVANTATRSAPFKSYYTGSGWPLLQIGVTPKLIDGRYFAALTLYRRDVGMPSAPIGGSYNFKNNTFIEVPSGWSVSKPSGAAQLYVSTAVAESDANLQDSGLDWSTPAISTEDPNSVYLSKPLVGVVDNAGVLDYSDAFGEVIVIANAVDVTAASEFQVAQQVNCVVTVNAAGQYQVAAVTGNNAYAVIAVKYASVEVTRTLTISVLRAIDVKDLTPPPDVTAVDISVGVTNVFVSLPSLPSYPQGGGHYATTMYYTEGSLLFEDAKAMGEFRGTDHIIASNLGRTLKLWFKFRTQDGVESVNAYGPLDATTGLIDGNDLNPLILESLEIADGSITSVKLADNAITAGKLAAGSIAVGTAAIANGAIVNAMIGSAAIDSAKIADAAIGSAKISNTLQSDNFNAGYAGWRLRKDLGSIEVSQLTVYDGAGSVVLSSGGVPYTFVSGRPTSLSDINSAEGSKLSGIAAGASADLTLVSHGAAGLSIVGNSVKKVSGANAYDTGVYSKDGYAGGAFVSWAVGAATHLIGLNSDPSLDATYSSIDYSLLVYGDGNIYVYESGAQRGAAVDTWAAGDVLAVVYDGTRVRYMKNGIVLYTTTAIITSQLFMDSTFHSVNASANNIKFGPLSSNDWSAIGGSGKPENNATVGADSTNLKAGIGSNMLFNAGANLSNEGWNGYPNMGRNLADWNIAQAGSRYGTFSLYEVGETGGGALFIDGVNKVPVVPGQRYELSIYTGAHRCRIAISADFWDANGNYLGTGNNITLVNGGENNEEMGGGINLSSYKRIGMFVTAPANAATSRFLCWKNETKPGLGNSYLFACLPFYGIAGAAQTELSPWSEGSAALNTQITASNASTYIANAAIGAAQIGSLSLVGTGNFSVKTGTSGARMEMDSQAIKVFDASGVKRVQLGNLDV